MPLPALQTLTSDALCPPARSRARSPFRALVLFSLLLAVVGFAPAVARAQDPATGGTLTVQVTDQRGPAPGALVKVTQATSGFSRLVRTGLDGRVTLTGLPPGDYDIHLPASGLLGALGARVIASSADVQTKVHGVVMLDGPETRWMRTSFMAEELTGLPLNQFRNFQSLVILRPGALPPTFANAENDTPQRSLTLRLNGQSGPQVPTRLDDQTNVNLWLPSHLAYVPPVEAIEALTLPDPAETAVYGFNAGADVRIRVKSGTNAAGGSAFEFFNGDALNSSPFRSRRLPLERHTAGGTLGGPLVRDRLFAFGSYEGYFSRVEAQQFYTVPDERLRNGDFSQALNGSGSLQRIYDPFTPGANTASGTGREQISYVGPPACASCNTGLNVLDPARIHPIARRILDLYPLPNRAGSGRAGLSNNFSRVESSATNRHNFDGKLSSHPRNNWAIWGRVSQMHAVVDDRWVFPIDPVDDDGGVTNVRQLAGGVTWVVNAGTTLDGSIGMTTLGQHVNSSDSFLGHYGLDVLGIPGTNAQGRTDLPLSDRYQGLPSFATGFSTVGTTPTWAPQTRDERTISGHVSISRFFGSHQLTAGYALNHFALDHWQPERQNPRGAFQFASNATRRGGGGQQSANSYNTYAAFLLGLVGSAGKSIQPELFTTREWQHALFVHGHWSPRQDLWVSAGLQWDYYPLLMRDGRGPEMTDLATLEVLVGGRGGVSKQLGLTSPTDNFAPRLGAVWRIGPTTLRARYNLYFDGLAWASPFRGDRSYPNAINARFLPPADLQPFGWFGTLDQGIPLIPLPDPNAGRLALPAFVADQRTLEADTLERPREHSWSLGVDRDLPHQFRAELAYVGTRGRDGWADININAVQHLGGGAGDRPYNVSPFFTTQPITVFRGYTDREYHALQATVHRYLRDGLTLRGAYTLSRSMTLGREYELPDFADRNWHPSADDRTHMLSLGVVWELPWRTERGVSGPAGWLLNDWQLNGIVTAFSGAPFTVRADATELNTPGNVQTADLIGPVVRLGDIGGDGFFYDPSAFAEPPGQRLGETTINQFRGPGGFNLDLSVFRNVPLAGRGRLQLRLEALNATNTPKYGNPEGNLSSSSFMRVLSLNDAYTERQIRLAARVTF